MTAGHNDHSSTGGLSSGQSDSVLFLGQSPMWQPEVAPPERALCIYNTALPVATHFTRCDNDTKVCAEHRTHPINPGRPNCHLHGVCHRAVLGSRLGSTAPPLDARGPTGGHSDHRHAAEQAMKARALQAQRGRAPRKPFIEENMGVGDGKGQWLSSRPVLWRHRVPSRQSGEVQTLCYSLPPEGSRN